MARGTDRIRTSFERWLQGSEWRVQLFAGACAVAITLGMLKLLVIAPALPRGQWSGAPLEVVWIERPKQSDEKSMTVPAVVKRAKPLGSVAPHLGTPAVGRLDARPEANPDQPSDRPGDARLDLTLPGADATQEWDGDLQRLVGRKSDPLERPKLLHARIQDNSLVGRLHRMTRFSECAELRAAITRATGSQLDVIMESMRKRDCRM
jgi:hypothetical protein